MHWNSIEKREIRKFGLTALILFGCLGAVAVWKHRPIPMCLFAALALVGCGFIVAPRPMRRVYSCWLSLAGFLGRLVTCVILTLAYYLVITPAALIKRVLGGRPLPVSPDSKASSYWCRRDEPVQPRERFHKRY
jgi:hypothetical protein